MLKRFQPSGNVEITVLTELCQRILDGKGMQAYRATSVTISFFKGNEDIMNCGRQRGVKVLEHAMKIVEKGTLDKIEKNSNDG